MAKKYFEDDWDVRFKAWKAEKEKRKLAEAKKSQKSAETKKPIEKKARYIIRRIEKAEKQTIDYLKEPKHIKIIKILIILIPLIILQFIFYSNFLASHDFNYFYDIGSQEDNYLSPINRISDKFQDSDATYRNLTSQLVYFNAPIAKGSEFINITIKFKDNFPENSEFLLGAKDQEEWHYKYNLLYNPTIEKLMQKYNYQKKDSLMLFKLNENIEDYTIEQFLSDKVPAVKLATDQNITIPEFKIENYNPSEFTINTALRGSLVFYVYIKDNFEVEVEKRDLNWYENEDILDIALYDLNNNLIASKTIKDDGEDGKNSDKDNTDEQRATLSAYNLNEGVYKLELKNNGDMLVTKIKLNQNKIILYKDYFPAQSQTYFNDFEKTSKIYFKISKPITLTAKTWHDYAANQTLKINDEKLKIRKRNKDYELELQASDEFYELVSEKNDIKITGPEFFAFSQDSWFNPFTSKKLDFKNNIEYLEKNADYVLVDYKPVKNIKDNWKTVTTTFNIKDVFIKDNKLSLMFNTPHLSEKKNETNQIHISIDWINITIHKPGLIEKYKEGKEQSI